MQALTASRKVLDISHRLDKPGHHLGWLLGATAHELFRCRDLRRRGLLKQRVGAGSVASLERSIRLLHCVRSYGLADWTPTCQVPSDKRDQAHMALRHLSSFMPTADGLLTLDLPRLGGILLLHLKSYEGLNTVFQNGRLNRDYFIAMLENRNVGLGPLPHRSWSSRHTASSSGKSLG